MVDAHTASHVLVIRAWFEPGHKERLRVRILQPAAADRPEQHLLTTPSPEAACRTVCDWLDSLSGPTTSNGSADAR